MARDLGKKIILAGDVSVSGAATAETIAAAAEADSNSLVVPLDDDEPVPRNLTEAETLTERPGRLSAADRAKARAIIAAHRSRGVNGGRA